MEAIELDKIPEISVIMPVYNVEKYLCQAVDSVLAQTYDDFELILVDDGSPDGCGAICDSYAAKDRRVKVVHQPNGGVSVARNLALKLARGKYVAFVDSDDWIADSMLEKLHAAAENTSAQIAMCDFNYEWRTFGRRNRSLPGVDVMGHDEAMIKLFRNKELESYLWDKLYLRELTTSYCPDGREYEDTSVMHHWVDGIKKLAVVHEPLYHYRMRRGSIVNNRNVKPRLDKLKADIDRSLYYASYHPGLVSDHELQAKVIESAVGAAKSVARNSSRDEAMQAIGQILEMSAPFATCFSHENMSGTKTAKRYRMMQKSPARFITKMRFEKMFQSGRRKKDKNLFD